MKNNWQKYMVRIVFIIFAAILLGFVYYEYGFNVNTNQIILTTFLVFSTLYYAWQTRRTVEIMECADQKRNRPKIICYLENQDDCISFVDLIIRNTGNESAKEISFSIDDDFVLFYDKMKFSDLRFIKNGIKDFPADRILRIPVISLFGKVDDFMAKNIVLIVKYRSDSGRIFEDNFQLDFSALQELQLGKPAVYKIEEHLKVISSGVKEISDYYYQEKLKGIIKEHKKTIGK